MTGQLWPCILLHLARHLHMQNRCNHDEVTAKWARYQGPQGPTHLGDDLTKTRQLYTAISYYKTTSALYAYRGSAPKVIYIANARRLLRYE